MLVATLKWRAEVRSRLSWSIFSSCAIDTGLHHCVYSRFNRLVLSYEMFDRHLTMAQTCFAPPGLTRKAAQFCGRPRVTMTLATVLLHFETLCGVKRSSAVDLKRASFLMVLPILPISEGAHCQLQQHGFLTRLSQPFICYIRMMPHKGGSTP